MRLIVMAYTALFPRSFFACADLAQLSYEVIYSVHAWKAKSNELRIVRYAYKLCVMARDVVSSDCINPIRTNTK